MVAPPQEAPIRKPASFELNKRAQIRSGSGSIRSELAEMKQKFRVRDQQSVIFPGQSRDIMNQLPRLADN